MTKNELNDLMIQVNRICFGDKFKTKFVEKFKYLPNGLTYHINEENNRLEFILTIKNYGYEHSFNNGVSYMSDAYDFDIGDNSLITSEIKNFVKEYFMHYETLFYNKYMLDAETN